MKIHAVAFNSHTPTQLVGDGEALITYLPIAYWLDAKLSYWETRMDPAKPLQFVLVEAPKGLEVVKFGYRNWEIRCTSPWHSTDPNGASPSPAPERT